MDRAVMVAWLRNKVCHYRNCAKQDRGWYIPVKPLEIEAIELQEIADELERFWKLEAEHQGCAEEKASLVRERDEARANYQFMVNRATDEKLDGYRELGQRAADAEAQRDAAYQALDELWAYLVEIPQLWAKTVEDKLDALDPRKQEAKS